jgi:Raf kinase inhibitor-like YbhB/YbcL family protein
MKSLVLSAFGVMLAVHAHGMELTSPDVVAGYSLAKAQLHPDCGGGNLAPALAWSGAPPGTKSFAVTVFDPDSSGGWWHWIAYDIAANTSGLPRGGVLPAGALAGENDFGDKGYGGACPPQGSGAHRYQFTVWAMGSAVLPLEGANDDKIIGAYIQTHALAHAAITATYER